MQRIRQLHSIAKLDLSMLGIILISHSGRRWCLCPLMHFKNNLKPQTKKRKEKKIQQNCCLTIINKGFWPSSNIWKSLTFVLTGKTKDDVKMSSEFSWVKGRVSSLYCFGCDPFSGFLVIAHTKAGLNPFKSFCVAVSLRFTLDFRRDLRAHFPHSPPIHVCLLGFLLNEVVGLKFMLYPKHLPSSVHSIPFHTFCVRVIKHVDVEDLTHWWIRF